MSRLLSRFVLAIMLLLACAQPAIACGQTPQAEIVILRDLAAREGSIEMLDTKEEQLARAIAQGVDALQDGLDLSSYGATLEQVHSAIALVRNTRHDLFYLGTVTIWHIDGAVTNIELHYDWPTSQIQTMRTELAAAVDEALTWVGYNMESDYDKAKALHDYLVRTCVYDYHNYAAGTIPAESYTAYGALVLGRAVCNGYAEAYEYLLEQVGIDSTIVSSDAMNHAWNVVTIYGNNYHVDVTWDDPVSFSTGQDGGFHDAVETTYFMLSDATMRTRGRGHHDWTPTPSCTDTRYENWRWVSYDGPVEPPYRFRDMTADDWFVTSGVIEYVVEHGLILGVSETRFAPNDPLTRAQFATIMWRYLEPTASAAYRQENTVNETGMPDVESRQWYTGAANWAIESGLIAGVDTAEGRRFKPNNPVTREQIVVMLLRMTDTEIDVDRDAQALFDSYADSAGTSSWARGSMLESLEIGLIVGSGGRLRPQDPCTRAEGGAFIVRAIEELAII
ncbi:S-layer homology domain-containing protein [Collinsella ihumii]|uniref:S-layer homology domain-containing protein n=1 Tax=Collinsella ihumii TaxID=1720204 RepID=A0ABT7XFE5_9ACTN|nr:S-layer homology domain-containing protein [Collinsella ihumii]MDN0064130.1 S-layer homology domain-containing protein [Collinsella ihumii]